MATFMGLHLENVAAWAPAGGAVPPPEDTAEG